MHASDRSPVQVNGSLIISVYELTEEETGEIYDLGAYSFEIVAFDEKAAAVTEATAAASEAVAETAN